VCYSYNDFIYGNGDNTSFYGRGIVNIPELTDEDKTYFQSIFGKLRDYFVGFFKLTIIGIVNAKPDPKSTMSIRSTFEYYINRNLSERNIQIGFDYLKTVAESETVQQRNLTEIYSIHFIDLISYIDTENRILPFLYDILTVDGNVNGETQLDQLQDIAMKEAKTNIPAINPDANTKPAFYNNLHNQ
jgi:hypothetical protein